MNFPPVLQLNPFAAAAGVTVISGVTPGEQFGASVASAGDVNGDGYLDLIIGAPRAAPNGTNSGTAYILFGTASGFPDHVRTSTLDGTDGGVGRAGAL